MMRLYHSFPRLAPNRRADELSTGLKTLTSILDIGLILTFEKIKFPFVTTQTVDFREGSVIDQLRCCFTFLNDDELVHHSAIFGAYAVEFEVETLREMGAFPVVYIPQPLRDERRGHREVSIIGNQLVHQLRDVAVLLEELIDLQNAFERNPTLSNTEVEVRTSRKIGTMKFSAIDLIVDHLLGSKVSFLNLLNSIQYMTNLFYSADSTRPEMVSLEHDVHYYLQREWRIVAGLMESHTEVDSPLTTAEIRSLEAINRNFEKEVVLRDGTVKRHSHLIRKLSQSQGAPL